MEKKNQDLMCGSREVGGKHSLLVAGSGRKVNGQSEKLKLHYFGYTTLERK